MHKKKAITLLANEQTYQKLINFDNIEQLNETIRQHKEHHKLNKNQLRVLNLLHRYSAKYTGVSFLTKNNIAKQLKISRRTVIRVCNHLEKLGIIKQHELKRESDMQQTSNAIVIQRIKQDDTQEVTQANEKNEEKCHTKKTTSISLKQTNNNNRKRYVKLDAGVKNKEGEFNSPSNFDYTHVSQSVPNELIKAIKPFFPLADDIYAIYKRLTIATRNHSDTLITHIDKYIRTFKSVVYRAKKKRVKSFYGYLYRAFERTCNEIVMLQNAKSKGVYFDWINT